MRILVAAAAVTLDALDTFLKTEGCDTLLAKDGTEALSLWESSRPYLVCLDIMMPQMDGFEVCRRIRKRDDAIPILFEGEGEIELSPREVAIIPLLHEHVGEAVHREALLGARLLPRVAHLGSAHRQDS